MKLFAAAVALAALVSSVVAQTQINTPTNVVQCQPIQLSWTGSSGDVFLSIHDGNNPSGPALLDFGTVSGTSLTWIANFTAGTSLSLALRDQTGATVQSAPFTVNSGSDSSCLSGGGGSTSAGSATSTSAGASTTATSPSTTGGASTSRSSGSATSSGTGTATSAGASESAGDGAMQLSSVGVAGLIIPALLALVA